MDALQRPTKHAPPLITTHSSLTAWYTRLLARTHSLKNEVFERSVTIHQLKARILDLEKVTNGASAGPNSARVQLEGVQLKLVNANNQVW
jgi:hypothetical protein